MEIRYLRDYYEKAREHQRVHLCGGVPYEHADVLSVLVASLRPQRILELGTGIGYTAAAMSYGFAGSMIDTIDKDESHLKVAQDEWESLRIAKHISAYSGKAEEILPTLSKEYDLIFFDGYAPSMKFLTHFEKLLSQGGVLVTANMFLKDPAGGKYMRALLKERLWKTGVFDDTAISVKVR